MLGQTESGPDPWSLPKPLQEEFDDVVEKIIEVIKKNMMSEDLEDGVLTVSTKESGSRTLALISFPFTMEQWNRLSPREKEATHLNGECLSNKQIALKLKVCEGTVEGLLHSVNVKLDFDSRQTAAFLSLIVKGLRKIPRRNSPPPRILI